GRSTGSSSPAGGAAVADSPPPPGATIYRRSMSIPGSGEPDVSRYVAETAERMNKRLTELSSFIRAALEDEIPELRGDARLIDLLGASVEGNVDTLLHALRYDIAVERVEPPTAALEYARRLAPQRGAVHPVAPRDSFQRT